MSDHHDLTDPIDAAYVQAETLLAEDAERAARRARVLAAVAREALAPATEIAAAAAPASPPPLTIAPVRPAGRRPAYWLAAAGVVGLSVMVATQIFRPEPLVPPVAAPPSAAEAPAPASAGAAAVADATPAEAPPPALALARPPSDANIVARARSAVPPQAAGAVAGDLETDSAPAPLAAAPIERNAPPMSGYAAAADEAGTRDKAVESLRAVPPASASRHAAIAAFAPEAAPAAPPPPPALALKNLPAGDAAARLRAAAAAGRTAELDALLAQGVPVDAPDAAGETALMKAVQADRPAAAALLRRRGASLDRRNRAGESARDMAGASGDDALPQAIGTGP